MATTLAAIDPPTRDTWTDEFLVALGEGWEALRDLANYTRHLGSEPDDWKDDVLWKEDLYRFVYFELWEDAFSREHWGAPHEGTVAWMLGHNKNDKKETIREWSDNTAIKTARALVNVRNLEEAFLTFHQCTGRYSFMPTDWEKTRKRLRRRKISATDMAALRSLLLGMDSRKRREEAFWKIVLAELTVLIEELLEIRDRFRRNQPLTIDDASEINQYFRYAQWMLAWWQEPDGRKLWGLNIDPICEEGGSMGSVTIDAYYRAQSLASLVACELAQEVHGFFSQRGPMMEVVCHAPSCGQSFYAPRPAQVTCPKERHQVGSSPCKREWDAYARWLRKTGRDAEGDWNDKKLKRKFLDQYQPRGSQVGR